MDISPNDGLSSNLLSLAVDRYNCYAGELVTLFLRFKVPKELQGFVQLSFPNVMQVESYQMPEGVSSSILSLSQLNQESILHVPLADSFMVDEIYEMSVSVRVKTFQMDQYLLSEAELFYGESISLAYEAVQIAVLSKAKYLKHLPEIYERDDFVSHFLMLIESFWKPISQQIEQMNAYFDPVLTSPVVLPWLASWVGLSVDKSLPLERVRALLKSAMIFYQQRGTLQALVAYLETFTGGEVHVLERRARNFILGKQCNLGVEIALGKENQPNSLLIEVAVPPEEIIALKLSNDMYQRKINDIVRSLVPAHTIFDVHCEFR